MRRRTPIPLSLLTTVGILISLSLIRGEQWQDELLAVVEGKPLFLSEVRLEMVMNHPRALLKMPATPSAEVLKKVTGELIDTLLIYELAKKTAVELPQERLKTRVEQAEENLKIVVSFAPQFKVPWKNEVLRERILAAVEREVQVELYVAHRVQITTEELQSYREELAEEGKSGESLLLRQLLIPSPETASVSTREERREQALELRRRLASGEDFTTLAQELSEKGATRQPQGYAAWFELEELRPELAQKVQAAPEGTVIGPVETELGFHIVRTEQRQGVEDKLFAKKYGEIREELARKLRAQAAIKTLF